MLRIPFQGTALLAPHQAGHDRFLSHTHLLHQQHQERSGLGNARRRKVPHERLVTPAAPPRSYAYCSDTRYIPTLHELLKDVSTLYHESTYTSHEADKAALYYHSTGEQAAQVAKAANVGKLLLGHYSARYHEENQLLKEAKSVFPNVYLTDEGMVFDV